MEIFDPIIEVFNFIYNFLDIIIQGIWGCIEIVTSLVDVVIDITRILPTELYVIFLAFMSVYVAIITYKLVRRG